MKNFLSLVVLLLVSSPITYSQTQTGGKKKGESKKVEMKKAEFPTQKAETPKLVVDKQVPKAGKKVVTKPKTKIEKKSPIN